MSQWRNNASQGPSASNLRGPLLDEINIVNIGRIFSNNRPHFMNLKGIIEERIQQRDDFLLKIHYLESHMNLIEEPRDGKKWPLL